MPDSKIPLYQRLVEEHGLSNAQKLIIGFVEGGKSVLEIGPSTGYMTAQFKAKGAKVSVVEMDKKAIFKVGKIADATFEGSIEDKFVRSQIKEEFDVIVCADVLEHLVDPGATLDFLKTKLKQKGQIVVSIPNVAFWDMRKQLFFRGDFSYKESGLMDRTHLRFYSLNNFLALLKEHGLKVLEITPAESRIPFEYSLKRIPVLGKLFLALFKNKLVKKFPNLTFYHYVVKAEIES